METKRYKLKDILSIGNGKDHSSLGVGEYPVYGSGGYMKSVDSFLYDGESVLLPRKGTLSNIQYVYGKFWTVDTCYYTKIDISLANPYYLYCLLRSYDLSGLDSGASIPSMTSKTYYGVKVELPSLDIQDKITIILKRYDSLIESNNSRIKVLEKMAENLYKEWFVRFRFPGHETAEFENGLPKGWKNNRIGDLVKIKSGYAFKSEWWIDEGVPAIKIKDIDNNTVDLTDLSCVSEEHAAKSKNYFVNAGDLLIALTGATIGKIALVPHHHNTITVNQRVGKFFLGNTPCETVAFLYCLFQQKPIQDYIIAVSGSNAAQPNISPFDIERIKIRYNQDVVDKFNKLMQPTIEAILELQRINQNLINQRDRLLPRLMSGKLEV